MFNVETKIEKDILTIKVDLKKRNGTSKSGKNETVATTGGNMETGVPGIRFGLNVFAKPAEK